MFIVYVPSLWRKLSEERGMFFVFVHLYLKQLNAAWHIKVLNKCAKWITEWMSEWMRPPPAL